MALNPHPPYLVDLSNETFEAILDSIPKLLYSVNDMAF